MGAPIGNQWWKLRSKHGRDKIFATSEIMWEAACEYFTHTENEQRWNEQNWVGKEGNEVVKHHPTPFTIQGLCLFLGVNTRYFNDFEDGIKGKDDKESLGFSEVIARIRDVIFKQKFEGASTGFFNANIIARELGLIDKQEIDQKTKIKQITEIEIVKA